MQAVFFFLMLCMVGRGVAQTDTQIARTDTSADVQSHTLISTADSTRTDADSTTAAIDPLRPWRHWPPIDRAIALAPLDGPADIIEKREIIADRVDDLRREAAGLDSLDQMWTTRSVGLTAQLETLEDLADVQLGGDLQLQQRIESVRDDATEALDQRQQIAAATADLAAEIRRWQQLADDYDQRAQRLRQQEEEPR